MTYSNNRPRALVIGGSLGGLFAGTLLRRSGWNVDIYERSAQDLDSRGGGIVLQPQVVALLGRIGTDVARMPLGVRSRNRVVFEPDGTVRSRELAPQTQTSWSLIYSTLKAAFGSTHYHQAKTLTDVRQDDASSTLTAVFDDGSEAKGDLLIGADGNSSTVRRLIWPDAEPTYAGYLAWRGLVPEAAMPDVARAGLHGDFGFANNTGSHILGYLVPGDGNDTRDGHRLYNWVWYRTADAARLQAIMTDRTGRDRGYSLPEGQLAPHWRRTLVDEAADLLPPPFRVIVEATAEPFAQAIRDLTVDRMVKDRVVLLGDAAFIPRPHTAASTSKAAANALALADALDRTPEDIDAALAQWEPEQIALGRRLYEQGTRAGDFLLFGRGPIGRVG